MQCKNITGETSGSSFHVFGRDSGVELPISDPDAIFDPNDADHIYSAKVMLMALPQPDELLQKTNIDPSILIETTTQIKSTPEAEIIDESKIYEYSNPP